MFVPCFDSQTEQLHQAANRLDTAHLQAVTASHCLDIHLLNKTLLIMNFNIERSLYISIHLLFELNHNDNACVNPCEPRTLLSRGTYTLALLCELIQAVFQLKV